MPSLPFKTKNTYEQLIAAFEDAAEGDDCGPVSATRPFHAKFVPADGSCITFDGSLHLKSWKARSSSGKERVDILIRVQETIECTNPPILRQSTVRVGYFMVQENRATLLHSTHFDYGPARNAHPIFHAQMTGEVFELAADVAAAIDFSYEQIPCKGCFKNARIPTSDMTLPSVLLCIAADHLQFEIFRDFYERVQELQRGMPQPIYDRTRASIHAAPDHLRSSHWFAHTS